MAGFGGGGSTAPLTIVSGMQNEDHSTRTLLLLRSPPSSSSSSSGQQRLLISRGSADNIDETAADINSGHSQIKAFDVSSHSLSSPQDFNSNGTLVAWGLRNSVGLAQHPATGGLYSVENSADNIFRQGKDVHQDNPGEELNFHGYLNDSASAASADRQSLNFGYPTCFATWEVSSLPGNASLAVGTPFAVDGPDGSRSKLDDADSTCAKQSVAPRLTFAAHTAPLDIKFNTEGSVAWVTFHGSWYVSVVIYHSLPLPSSLSGSGRCLGQINGD